VVREGYATAAAAAGVKTLFCRGFGRGFFLFISFISFLSADDQNCNT
jgi:hypothetical protein